jgi:hypothetical protein
MGYVAVECERRHDAFEPERLARGYIAALNERELEPLLEFVDPAIEFYPTALSRTRRRYVGHAGIQEWLETAEARGNRYHGHVTEVRNLGGDRWAILGDVLFDGEKTAPLGVVIRLRDGLIIESRSYLSDEDLLRELGLLP